MARLDQHRATGSVTTFCGATGLLEKVLSEVVGTEVSGETIDATPNGSKTSFSGSIANYPCGLGRLSVTYTVGAAPFTATDDGSGRISGTYVSSGSITYSSGAWSLTFSTAPDNGSTITADYLYGNPGADWQQKVKEDTEDPSEVAHFNSECKQVILQNTGSSGAENVLIGMREWRYLPEDLFGWDLNGYTSYSAGQTWHASNAQHGLTGYDYTREHWTMLPVLPLIDDTLYYWIYSNRQRIVLVVKSKSRYESIYLGFGRRFSAASDYRYPLVIKGSTYGNEGHASDEDRRTFVAGFYHRWNSGYDLLTVDPDGDFIVSGGGGWEDGITVQPHSSIEPADGVVVPTKGSSEILMTPVYYAQPSESRTLLDLDGVYHCMGTKIQSEDLLIQGGLRHKIFQNVHRAAPHDFMAVVDGTTTTTTSSTTTTTTSSTTSTTTAP